MRVAPHFVQYRYAEIVIVGLQGKFSLANGGAVCVGDRSLTATAGGEEDALGRGGGHKGAPVLYSKLADLGTLRGVKLSVQKSVCQSFVGEVGGFDHSKGAEALLGAVIVIGTDAIKLLAAP